MSDIVLDPTAIRAGLGSLAALAARWGVVERAAVGGGRAARMIIALSIAGLASCAVEPPEPAPVVTAAPPPTPFGWMPARPVGEPLKHATASRLIVRLGADAVDGAERLYGPPVEHGGLSGWWLRPITPLPTGGWLFFSASGALYGLVAPPGLVDDLGNTALARAGRAWWLILREVRSAD